MNSMDGIKSLYVEIFNKFKIGSVSPILFEPISTELQPIENSISLVKAINQRRSNRTTSKDPVSIGDLSYILEASLGVTNKTGDNFFYRVPCAGGERGLRYVIIPQNVDGLSPRSILEYVPETCKLIGLSQLRGDIFYSDWESFANFNVIFCASEKSTRKYKNNEFLACFEAGCCSQNLQLISTSLNYASCVSGVINAPEFIAHFDDLMPLQAISFSKE